ncbi:zinc finger MYM-type protein 4-like [Brachionichthys hirsutus]|uniref:zinc finger MYM-type protein 4-like n=1 Tax=Brachionichthys hirsutus TaxID=412623 RepID=UPI003604A009
MTMSFSDEDEDTSVEFDIDSDEDNVGNERKDGNSDTKKEDNSSRAKKIDSSVYSRSSGADREDGRDTGADREDTVDTGADHEDTVDTGADREDSMDSSADNDDAVDSGAAEETEQSKWLDTESRGFSATLETGKINMLQMTCSHCKKNMLKGQTAFQKKGFTDLFCSKVCLFVVFPVNKSVTKSCHFCHKAITQPKDVLRAPVDAEETIKEFCSQSCLSSFNCKRLMANRIPIVHVTSHSQCSICSKYCISKHEIIHQDVAHKICSDPCYHRFCNMNNVSVCDNCHSHCSSPVVLKMKGGSKTMCSAECTAQFKQKTRTLQPCNMCGNFCLMLDMVENRNSDDAVELFCASSCVKASKIQAVCAFGTAGVPFSCDNCGKATAPVCHLAMSDDSIRSFCTLACAMTFKDKQNSITTQTAASNQTQGDFFKAPEKLICAQCGCPLYVVPNVIERKDKIYFVCSLTCCEEFKRSNEFKGKCDYCKNEGIISKSKRVDKENRHFCSDGCRELFCQELEKRWGSHCQSCAYCYSISKTVVTRKHKGKKETFCSGECHSKYTKLLRLAAKCDACGHQRKLRQSLAMLGDVKHFCDLKCLLQFCSKKVQLADTDDIGPKVLPIPVPVYVPVPMTMFNQFVPQPLSLPLPLTLHPTPLVPPMGGEPTEVKRPDGAPYSPDNLFYLCLSIQQYLFENGRWENIFHDQGYNNFIEGITKILKGFEPSVAPISYVRSRVEEEFLWDCKQLGAYSPIVLLNTLIFFCCKHFGFTTVEQHRQLSFAHVMCYTRTNRDQSKTAFLRFYPQISACKTNADGHPAKKHKRLNCEDILEMKENTENPLRCPVRHYEFYLSKCSESVNRGINSFYLLPERSCLPSSPRWFSSTPLDNSTIEAILLRILTIRELHGRPLDQQRSDGDEESL